MTEIPAEPYHTAPSRRSTGAVAGLIFCIACAVRLLRFHQSLWGDELNTLLHYVITPWHYAIAPGPGQYVPNDHALYTVLARLCLMLGAGGNISNPDWTATLIRLPSLLAGSLVPIALAWPLRRRMPIAAVVVAGLACVHPWLVAQSDEARGYALMTLLGIVATNLLPTSETHSLLKYAVAVSAAMYAVPVAALLLAAHGFYILIYHRGALIRWLRGAGLAVAFTAALFVPAASGMIDYYRHPLVTPHDYPDFINQLFRFALAGQSLPPSYDPTHARPDPFVGIAYWIVPVTLLVAGTTLRWRGIILTHMMAGVTLLGVLTPLLLRSADQVRFFPWAAVWLCLAITAVLLKLGELLNRPVLWVAFAATFGWMLWIDLHLPPDQPVRDAIHLADQLAPVGEEVLVAFLTADHSVAVYGVQCRRHQLHAAPSPMDFAREEALAVQFTGHRPWLVVSYESTLVGGGSGLWEYLQTNYRLVTRLPGRITPSAVYAPREEARK